LYVCTICALICSLQLGPRQTARIFLPRRALASRLLQPMRVPSARACPLPCSVVPSVEHHGWRLAP
jgi:hypothetical protein